MPLLLGIAILGDTTGGSLWVFISRRIITGIGAGAPSPGFCGDGGGWDSGGSGNSGGCGDCSPELPEIVKVQCGEYGVALIKPILLK